MVGGEGFDVERYERDARGGGDGGDAPEAVALVGRLGGVFAPEVAFQVVGGRGEVGAQGGGEEFGLDERGGMLVRVVFWSILVIVGTRQDDFGSSDMKTSFARACACFFVRAAGILLNNRHVLRRL